MSFSNALLAILAFTFLVLITGAHDDMKSFVSSLINPSAPVTEYITPVDSLTSTEEAEKECSIVADHAVRITRAADRDAGAAICLSVGGHYKQFDDHAVCFVDMNN